MKILHIAPTPFFADRGCHMRILGEIRALQDQGHEIILTTYHLGRDVENLEIRRIVNVPWYNKLEAGSSWHQIYLDALLLFTTLKTCLYEKPDVIHGHLHEGAVIGKFASVLCSLGKIPVVFDVQGSLTDELETYGFFDKIKLLRPVFTLIEKMICRLPDYIVCSSESNEDMIKCRMNVSGDRVSPVPDAINSGFFSIAVEDSFRDGLAIPDNKRVVIYTGSLMKSKGIDFLLDAIPKVMEKCSDVHFLVVGYPVDQSVEKVQQLGVSDMVTFTGKTEFAQIPKYLSVACLAVDPKTDEAGEGSGKIINYMGAGLPIVCFDSVNNRKLLDGSGVYADSGNVEDLAGKIVDVLSDDSLARSIGENNKKRVNELFSWDVNGKKLTQIYDHVRQMN